MKKLFNRLLTIIAFMSIPALFVIVAHPDWIVDPPSFLPTAYALSDKCSDSCVPNPDRNYFDLWGNEFDYQGNLIKVGSCVPDPVSGKPNPQCPISVPTGCPYGDAVPLGPECDKLGQQQNTSNNITAPGTVNSDQTFEGK